VSNTKQLSHYIDGQWVQGAPASDSLNPSDTRDIVAKVPGGDKSTVDSAVSAAKAAFPAWANASPEVRSDLLDKAGSAIMARADELGRLLSREEGKTLPEGKGRWAIVPHHLITPETEKTTHYYQVLAHQWAPSSDSWRFLNSVIDEDVWAIENQQRNIDLRPDAPTHAIGSDAAMLAMHKIVQRMLQAEIA
jgi:hypothetical protein